VKGKVLMKIRVRPCGGARFARSTMNWTAKKKKFIANSSI
jgi:hypothetical protein